MIVEFFRKFRPFKVVVEATASYVSKLPWSQAFLGSGIHGPIPSTFGVEAIPAFVLVGPDGKIVARGMRGEDIKRAVAKAPGKTP